MPIIAPSLLAADFLNLGSTMEMLESSAADWLHLDVMDGSFVPNISFGFPIIEQLRAVSTRVFDVHLMIENPEKYITPFKKAGADNLTVHIENSRHLHRTLQQIKDAGMLAGVALNPHTPVSLLMDVIEDVDMVILMSVNPGFGGQSFIPNTLKKIRALREMVILSGKDTHISVDGGVVVENAGEILSAGADVLIAGSSVFRAEDPKKAIEELKKTKFDIYQTNK